MADVFGDLSLFSEFEREREAKGSFIHYEEDTDRSRIIFEGYESYEDDDDDDVAEDNSQEDKPAEESAADPTTAEVKKEEDAESTEKEDGDKEVKEEINGTTASTKEDKKSSLSVEDAKTIAWLNDQLHEQAAEEAKQSTSVNQVIYEKNKFRRFSQILDSTRYLPNDDSPAVQLLFSNNAFSRKYRQQIEQFIKGLLWNEFQSGSKAMETCSEVTVRPGALSCIEINSKLNPEQRTEELRQKHTIIGNSQFHNKFLIDFLGWPFSEFEPKRCNVNWEIPLYTQIFNQVFADPANQAKNNPKKKPKPSCWNCGGENHSVAECRMPRNPARIAASRKEFMEQQGQKSNKNKFTGASRYHLDPEIASKYAKFQPGQVSESLRAALGLSSAHLPSHIYKMRLYGYPPGWLEEAKQIQSGVSMFDKHGKALPVAGQCLEDGELADQGMERDPTDDYDINKIIEYPGFTVAVPEGITDDHESFSMPPIQDHQLKATLMQQSKEKASSRKRKRVLDDGGDQKDAGDFKKSKVEDEEGVDKDKENEEGEEKEEGQADMEEEEEEKEKEEVEEEEVKPKLNKSFSSTVSISKDYGTPILVREKLPLPDAAKFGVGVEEHLPFENLPNSTGTFDKMKDLIGLIRRKKTAS